MNFNAQYLTTNTIKNISISSNIVQSSFYLLLYNILFFGSFKMVYLKSCMYGHEHFGPNKYVRIFKDCFNISGITSKANSYCEILKNNICIDFIPIISI